MTIPIRNLYYLFCYAWARFPPGDAVDVGIDECPDLENLFARLLVDGGRRVIRRGLERGYADIVDEMREPRGRLQFDQMAKAQTLERGIVVCAVDELRYDVLHNQILKATARHLAQVETIERETAHALRLFILNLRDVSDIRLSQSTFRRVQLGRNNGQYALLMQVCEFVYRSLLPARGGFGARFADILEDEARMSAVFEDFVRNFYAFEQKRYSVAREVMKWDAQAEAPGQLGLLPVMLTDATLRSDRDVLVIDAKYYKEMFVRFRGGDRVRSAHLYQLLTYLRHAARADRSKSVRGALIYPAIDGPVSIPYVFEGFRVQLEAVDLTRPWPNIKAQLIGIVADGD